MKSVLITGATSGIGKELAKEFAKHKFDLVLTGRNKEKLEYVSEELVKEYSIKCFTIVSDLRNENSSKYIYQKVKENNISIDILINNAGFGIYGDFLLEDLHKQNELIDVNIKAVMNLCYWFGKDMKDRKKGKIINLSSISGYLPGPYMASYYASKAFILSFSLALEKELKPYHVEVYTLCPEVINTPFYDKANANLKYSLLLKNMPPKSPQKLVKYVFKKIKKKKYLLHPGLKNKCIIFLQRFLSKKITLFFVSKIQKKQKNI